MHTRRKTLLLSGLVTVSIVGSLFLGITLGSSDFLQKSPILGEQSTKESLLEKLEQTASLQTQPQTPSSLFGTANSGFSNSLFADPIAQMQQMEAEMDRIFSGFTSPMFASRPSFFGGSFASLTQPQVDVQETDDEFRVVISMAEGSELELQTDLADNTLSISAQVRNQTQNNSGGRQTSSSFMSQFSRDIFLDAPVDATGMKTEKSDSAVTIRIPKLS